LQKQAACRGGAMKDEAPKTSSEALNRRRLIPSQHCVLCNRMLAEVGGMRIIAQKIRGVCLSDRYRGGGNKDYPHKSVKLYEESDKYVVVWGEKNKWTEEAIERARTEFLAGLRPWFCQLCGERRCSSCGSPINYPMGSDVLYDSGCSSHCGMHPFDPGCINPDCKKYKDWSHMRNDK